MARMERVLLAPRVFLTLGPLKVLGRAEIAREAVAAAIIPVCSSPVFACDRQICCSFVCPEPLEFLRMRLNPAETLQIQGSMNHVKGSS